MQDLTKAATPNPNCPACTSQRIHQADDWKLYHPYKGHGYIRETGWTHPDLEPPK